MVIFGGGNVGETAAKTCSILGARTIMVEKKEVRREYLEKLNLSDRQPRLPIEMFCAAQIL